MFGFLDTIFSWIFGTIFYFALARVEDVVTWLLPIYVTVEVLRQNETTKFNNYLSFWCLASLLFGLDWISGFLLHSILLFRIVRVCFLIWIFVDSCHNSVFVVNTFLTPVIDEHRATIDAAFEKLNDKIDEVSNAATTQAKDRLGSIVKDKQQELATGLLSMASAGAQSITSLVSNPNSQDTSEVAQGNDNNNTSQTPSVGASDSTAAITATTAVAPAAATAGGDDSKDVEK